MTMFGSMPKHIIAEDRDYRINCDKLDSNSRLSFLAAVTNPEKSQSPRPPHWVHIYEQHEDYGEAHRRDVDLVCADDTCAPLSKWRSLLNRIAFVWHWTTGRF